MWATAMRKYSSFSSSRHLLQFSTRKTRTQIHCFQISPHSEPSQRRSEAMLCPSWEGSFSLFPVPSVFPFHFHKSHPFHRLHFHRFFLILSHQQELLKILRSNWYQHRDASIMFAEKRIRNLRFCSCDHDPIIRSMLLPSQASTPHFVIKVPVSHDLQTHPGFTGKLKDLHHGVDFLRKG